MHIDIDPTRLGGPSKWLNAKFLKTVPEYAVKIRIVGGGQRQVDDKDKPLPNEPGKFAQRWETFLNVTSTQSPPVFEGEMEMALNKTNMDILLSGLGQQINGWLGREIGAFFDPTVKFGGQAVGGLKVMVFEANPFAKLAAAAAPPTLTVASAPDVTSEIPF